MIPAKVVDFCLKVSVALRIARKFIKRPPGKTVHPSPVFNT